MQIVIDIDDRLYNRIKYLEPKADTMLDELMRSIKSGTPLPKGHGDLIDRSKIYKAIPAEEDNCTGFGMSYDEMDAYNEGIDEMYNSVRGAKPIIEADKAESEGDDNEDIPMEYFESGGC